MIQQVTTTTATDLAGDLSPPLLLICCIVVVKHWSNTTISCRLVRRPAELSQITQNTTVWNAATNQQWNAFCATRHGCLILHMFTFMCLYWMRRINIAPRSISEIAYRSDSMFGLVESGAHQRLHTCWTNSSDLLYSHAMLHSSTSHWTCCKLHTLEWLEY